MHLYLLRLLHALVFIWKVDLKRSSCWFERCIWTVLESIWKVDMNGKCCYKSRFGNNRQLHCFRCRRGDDDSPPFNDTAQLSWSARVRAKSERTVNVSSVTTTDRIHTRCAVKSAAHFEGTPPPRLKGISALPSLVWITEKSTFVL